MLYEVLGDIWVVQRNPYLEDDLLDNPKRRAPAGRRAAPPAERDRRAGAKPATRNAMRTSRALLAAARGGGGEASQPEFEETADAARTGASNCWRRHTRADNIRFDGLRARLARHRRHRLARRVSRSSSSSPDTEDEIPGLVRACIELGLTIIPRGGGTGYTGGAVPLTTRAAVINTEKLERLAEVERIALPGRRRHRYRRFLRRRRRHQARRGTRPSAPASLRRRSDLGRCLLHRRQHRDECRRQEGRAVGHRARQPRLVAHGRPGRQLARGRHA